MNNGSFILTPSIREMNGHTKFVAPFLSTSVPSTGSISYEIHQRNTSQHILSLVNNLISQHENTSFYSKWLLVATWTELQELDYTFVSIASEALIVCA